MTKEEIEKLLELLRKFQSLSGESIYDLEVKLLNWVRSNPFFLNERGGVFMDDKLAHEHDMNQIDENGRIQDERERNERY